MSVSPLIDTPSSMQSFARQLDWIRGQYPGLQRRENGKPAVFLDGPAGTQVPTVVAEAVSRHLLHHNANHGGVFTTSRENDAIMDEAHRAAADLLGASDPAEIAFGGNMTTLTLHLSRALSRTWTAGDQIIVTRMDHDANVRPWVLAARDAEATVHFIPVNVADCTLDMQAFHACLNDRTRLVAVGGASNSVGTINPIAEIVRATHAVGGEVFVDAVHYAPHRRIDIDQWGCDYLACSAYKFFGPHVGLLWGHRERMETLKPYKLNPAPDSLPDRWMTGTQNFASIAGTLAAINYLADIGRSLAADAGLSRRDGLTVAMSAIENYENALVWKLIDGLRAIPGIHIYGITDRSHAAERMPTISLISDRFSAKELAEKLSQRGIYTWHGNYYAWELSHALGREPEGMLRLGLVHYNTADEVERVIEAIGEICSATISSPL